MAVTIDEMQIDVRSSEGNSQAQAPAAAPAKEPVDLRQQLALLAERTLRLQTE
jgi:hypothetical protein